MGSPTEQAYAELQQAYDVFNTQLFDGELPPCLITMQRRPGTYGYFSGNRWHSAAGAIIDEIALNPVYFATRSVADLLATLAHEMVHLWQHHFGTPSRRAYHNREWATQMDAIGLCPSHTGAPGGKRTGQSMSHYIVEGGPFHRVYTALVEQEFALSWQEGRYAVVLEKASKDEREGEGKAPSKSGVRVKYTCPTCKLNAWAKADVVLLCGACQIALVPC